MFCEHCDCLIEVEFLFCPQCGTELDREVIITYYFEKGSEYEKILSFLDKFHGITMSLRTLKSRLKSFGLSRRSVSIDEQLLRRRIRQELDGPGRLHGYRALWHTLRLEGIFAPRNVIERLLKEIDPEGCESRKAKRLTRRNYISMGPNVCWHIDGYDKLKPYGFPIRGCIDGCSRKIIWLQVCRTNNNPLVVAQFYMQAVAKLGGCPAKVRSDCGTENGIIAAVQCYLQNDEQAHIYGSSPHNQRIEGWWSFFRRSRSQWWIQFFKDLIEKEDYTPGHGLQAECLWFCFSGILQQDLDYVKNHWNTHCIRQSRFDTISGRPDELNFIPEYYGLQDYLVPVSEQKLADATNEYVASEEDTNVFQEYFQYVMETNGLPSPTGWNDALTLYYQLLNFAQD